jgi:hypothetical protein
MSNLESIKFQKLDTMKFTEQEKKDLLAEFKKRKITYRLTQSAIIFDERFLKDVRDLIPPSNR